MCVNHSHTKPELLTPRGAASAEPREQDRLNPASPAADLTPAESVSELFLFTLRLKSTGTHAEKESDRIQRSTQALSVHIKRMAAVWSKLMLHCGAISILLA